MEHKALVTVRNPPLGEYIALWKLLFKPGSDFSQLVAKEGLTFPYADSLEKRGQLLAFQIETIVGIYRFSKEGGGISTPIHTLTIDLQGRIEQNF